MGVTSAPAPGAASPTARAADELHQRRRMWYARRLLRSAYGHAWAQLAALAAPGPSLEIGCGGGNLDGILPQCWKSDIIPLPWADLAADALRLPVRSGALANIVGTDVLHHLPRPLDFLAEAARALRPDGRLLLLEPFMSRLSYPVYRHLHHEPADLRCDPLTCEAGNQAAPSLLFWRHPQIVLERLPQLELLLCQPRDAIVYPLSGGYSYPALLPRFMARWAWRAEQRLTRLMPMIGFRLAIAMRRKEGP